MKREEKLEIIDRAIAEIMVRLSKLIKEILDLNNKKRK